MLRILVAGGFDQTDRKANEIAEFSKVLAQRAVDQGHLLVNGCQNDLDKLVAEAAWGRLLETKVPNPESRLIGYVLEGREPVHKCGRILRSARKDWSVDTPALAVPEAIELVDAIILMGGFSGTMRVANWGRISKKPLLPLASFGGAAQEIYADEIEHFNEKYSGQVDKLEYAVLSQLSDDWPKLANEVVALAEKIATSKSVFIIMSFSQDPALIDASASFKEVGAKLGYDCERIDDSSTVDRILPAILDRIRRAAFVIVDLSEPRPNVYYELGFAQALGKPVVVTAKDGTQLPFDAKDIPTIFWKGQTQLKSDLEKRIRAIAESQGRITHVL